MMYIGIGLLVAIGWYIGTAICETIANAILRMLYSNKHFKALMGGEPGCKSKESGITSVTGRKVGF